MAENVTISEGEVGRRFGNVSKIITDKAWGNGRDTWVPASERRSGTKYIRKNGTYKASDEGLHSWNKVTVSVSGGAKDKLDDEDEVEIPAGLEPAEPIEQQDDGDDDEGGQEKPTYDPTDEDSVKAQQPQVKQTDSSIIGTDPDTGKPKVVDGKGNEKAVTAYMEITKNPDKLEYAAGDEIDFTGLVCGLFSEKNKRFSDETHPDGNALEQELSFPVTRVPAVRANEGYETGSDEIDVNVQLHNNGFIEDSWIVVNAEVRYCSLWNKSQTDQYVYLGSTEPFNFTCYHTAESDERDPITGHTVIIEELDSPKADHKDATAIQFGGKTIYLASYRYYSPLPTPTVKMFDGVASQQRALEILFGLTEYSVPVDWLSPYDGMEYRDSFKVKIIEYPAMTPGVDPDEPEPEPEPEPPDDGGLPDDYYYNPTASGDGSNPRWWGYGGGGGGFGR